MDENIHPLRRIREHLGLSQSAVAESLCTQPHIHNIEKDRKDPSLDLLRGLAKKMACEPADFLSTPTEARLAQIKANFDARIATASQATADALAGKEAGAA